MPALIANTTPVDVTAIRSPASAGPAKMARLSIVLAMAFAAVSCVGLVVREGVSAAWVERNGAVATAAATASA